MSRDSWSRFTHAVRRSNAEPDVEIDVSERVLATLRASATRAERRTRARMLIGAGSLLAAAALLAMVLRAAQHDPLVSLVDPLWMVLQ